MQNRAETLHGLGMTDAALGHWAGLRGAGVACDRAGAFTAASRNMRLLLQSAMLGLGAWLTLQGALISGLMIAGSVLLARSLAPLLDRARQARPGL